MGLPRSFKACWHSSWYSGGRSVLSECKDQRARDVSNSALQKMARFKQQTRELILQGVRDGMGIERASFQAGVHPTTSWRWRHRGKRDRAEGRATAYARFAHDFDIAEANAIAQLEVSMHTQARDDWRAAAWLLSRRRRDEYGEVEITDVVRKQVIEELFDFLQARARPETFNELCELLSRWGDTELDPTRLPCPG